MPPKPKSKLFPSVRVTDVFYNTTVGLADKAGEYLSEYIRKAVEQRNAQYKRDKAPNSVTIDIGTTSAAEYREKLMSNYEEKERKGSTHKNDTVSKPEPFRSFPKGGK
jgi:hypothetical protein